MWLRSRGGSGPMTPGPWVPVDLHAEQPASDHAEWYGEFQVLLVPGEIREYGLLAEPEEDPNAADVPRFIGFVSIWAIARITGETGWLSDWNTGVGGTFISKSLMLTRPAAVRLALSADPLPLDADGRPIYPAAPDPDRFRLIESSTFQTWHEGLMARFLLAGTLHHLSMLFVDPSGRWSLETDEVTTRQRSYSIRFISLVVHDDSDFDVFDITDAGEIEVRLLVYEGSERVQEFVFGRQDVTDEGPPIALGPGGTGFVHSAGPGRVPADRRHVGIAIRASEDDDLGTDAAWSHPSFPGPPGHPGHLLDFPSAQGTQLPGDLGWSGETVSVRPVSLTAFPASAGSTLHLTVNLEYSVSYPVA
jgi:hypothetical protein